MIHNKPFSFTEMLRRTIFLGRPNFFNAKDMNKELMILHTFIEEFNKFFAVQSDINFAVLNFNETTSGSNTTRTLNLQWADATLLYKGIRFTIPNGGINNYSQVFPVGNPNVTPRPVRPNTYLVLTAELRTLTYADNPELCGIQADEYIGSAPSVNVEQYQNIQVQVTANPDLLDNVICVLATIHPRYDETGTDLGNGFMYHVFRNPDFKVNNGYNRELSELKNNESLYEYILENCVLRLSNVLNERQLIRRFNLADLDDAGKARRNIGLSDLVNRRQLVQAENLADLTNLPRARQNLGLGNSAVRNVGTGQGDVAPGNIMPVGIIAMWSGSASAIPANWALCDGTTSNGVATPDLRGRFIVGHDPGQDEFKPVGKTGGDKKVSLINNNLPDHDHAYAFGQGSNGAIGDDYGGTGISQVQSVNNSEADMEEEVSPDGQRLALYKARTGKNKRTTANAGADVEPVKILPPYYALCFIMYTGTSIAAPEPLPAAPQLTYPNFSTPSTGAQGSDNGYSDYSANPIGGSNGTTVGGGIILTNPE